MAEKVFEIEVISPQREFYRGNVQMVEFNTTEGYLGILPGHAATTVILAPGTLVIHEEVIERKVAIHAGFAKITQNKVMILAEIAEWPDEIDLERAERAKQRAEKRLEERAVELDVARAQFALQRAITRIESKD